jgi:protein associated with RNAse G/E
MVKKLGIMLLFLLLSSTLVFAEKMKGSEKPEKPTFGFTMNLGVGLSSYKDSAGVQKAYQKFSFFPEFSYGKFGAGLDLTFEFDGNFKLRDLDNDGSADGWSTFTDYLYKIYYIRYGYPEDPFYVKVGSFDSYTLGHGLIMDDFSNTLFYPQVHQLGLNLNLNGSLFQFPYLGMETVVDDVLDWDIIGLRVYARPLLELPTPIINKLELGASIVTDLDTKEVNDPSNPDYAAYRSPNDNPGSDKIVEVGVDAEVPIIEQKDMSLITYADWAAIMGKGTGGFVGSNFTYQWFTIIGQLRLLGPQFVVNYFGPYYEVERATKYQTLDLNDKFTVGYLLGTRLALFKILNFHFFWSDVFDVDYGPEIRTGISTVENALGKLDASFSYEKKDIQSFSSLFNGVDTLLQLQIGYRISSASKIVLTYQRTYDPAGGPQDKTFVETRFSF